ncbi:hypothetical protein LOK49_LG07G02121 [Camellia lanceoleosa]|uniref:Uncharacterized protein n=1 Tax=Camellia lanceoleosa TaxID=1840588 RepID=A0ACC0H467_9ERIC|nr:hypothetical protein LOK49_LG07G02121 [Camellia lanceoleosa]
MGISVNGSDLGPSRVKETIGSFDRVHDCIPTSTQADDRAEGIDSRRQEVVAIGTDLVSTEMVGLKPNEIQLGLGDVVDRSTSQFLRVERRTDVDDLVADEDVAIEYLPDVDRMVHEVEGDFCDPQGVLQALEEYGSLDSSDESVGLNEEAEDYSEEERADDVELNLTGLYHEEEVPDSSCIKHTGGFGGEEAFKSCKQVGASIDRDNMNSSLHPHIQVSHFVSVRGVGQEGESVLGPCFLQASRKFSNKSDNLPLLHTSRTSISGSLNPQLNNMDTNRTDLSREKSPNHRSKRNTVNGNDGSESERWLREMSKYVSFPLEEDDVPHFTQLLETLGLALVRNTGKKSRAKREGPPSGGNRNHRGSGLRKGLRELRNLASGINYEGRGKEGLACVSSNSTSPLGIPQVA